MFREMIRKNQALTQEECISILKKEPRGVLSVLGDDGYPYGMPLNQYYSESDGKLYFHSGAKGHKIEALKQYDKASFCVYDQGYHKDDEWFLRIRSVIVFGRIEWIEDQDTIYRIARELCYKFTNDEDYIANEIKHAGPRTIMFALVPEHISGKLVKES